MLQNKDFVFFNIHFRSNSLYPAKAHLLNLISLNTYTSPFWKSRFSIFFLVEYVSWSGAYHLKIWKLFQWPIYILLIKLSNCNNEWVFVSSVVLMTFGCSVKEVVEWNECKEVVLFPLVDHTVTHCTAALQHSAPCNWLQHHHSALNMLPTIASEVASIKPCQNYRFFKWNYVDANTIIAIIASYRPKLTYSLFEERHWLL